jgi:WD40-like Beta Propeller Repeat
MRSLKFCFSVVALVRALTTCDSGESPTEYGPAAKPINGGLIGALYFSNLNQVFRVDLATGSMTELGYRNEDTPAGTTFKLSTFHFDISKDNRTLFFMDDLTSERLAAVNLETTLITTVFSVSRAADWAEVLLSPDGQKVALVKEGINGGQGVYIFEYSGRRIVYFSKTRNVAGNSIAWTRDNRLLFTDNGIYLTDRGDLTNSTQISPIATSSIALNPAGNKIAYTSQNHIWVMDVAGSGATQITASDNAEFRPRWSPDGKYIVFKSAIKVVTSGRAAVVNDIYDLAVVPADGRRYTLRTLDSPRSRGTAGGDGVILLQSRGNSGSLTPIIADDMIWRER